MSREIKFRAWDKTMKKMSYPKLWDNSMPSNWEHWFELQQFTGKKDCKGKEVYEGDIVEFDIREWGGDDNIHVVSWNDRDSEWCFGGGSASDMEWRTVIGNIYETPEILSVVA